MLINWFVVNLLLLLLEQSSSSGKTSGSPRPTSGSKVKRSPGSVSGSSRLASETGDTVPLLSPNSPSSAQSPNMPKTPKSAAQVEDSQPTTPPGKATTPTSPASNGPVETIIDFPSTSPTGAGAKPKGIFIPSSRQKFFASSPNKSPTSQVSGTVGVTSSTAHTPTHAQTQPVAPRPRNPFLNNPSASQAKVTLSSPNKIPTATAQVSNPGNPFKNATVDVGGSGEPAATNTSSTNPFRPSPGAAPPKSPGGMAQGTKQVTVTTNIVKPVPKPRVIQMSKPTVTVTNQGGAAPKSPNKPKPTNIPTIQYTTGPKSPTQSNLPITNQYKLQSPSITSTTQPGGAAGAAAASSPGSVVAKVTTTTTTQYTQQQQSVAMVASPSKKLVPVVPIQTPVWSCAGNASSALPVIGKLATDLSIVKQRLTDDGSTYTVGEGEVNTRGPNTSASTVGADNPSVSAIGVSAAMNTNNVVSAAMIANNVVSTTNIQEPNVGVSANNTMGPDVGVNAMRLSGGVNNTDVMGSNASASAVIPSTPSAACVSIETNRSSSVPPPQALPKRIPMAAPRRIATPSKTTTPEAAPRSSNPGLSDSMTRTPPRHNLNVSVANDNKDNDTTAATPEQNKSNVVIVSGSHGYYTHKT